MSQWVEIKFDCLPLRSIPRLDIPVDASPKFAEKVARIKQAVEQHGTHNTYYVHNAKCTFHLTNDPSLGMVEFRFEGTVFTDESDVKAVRTIVDVHLEKENCGWLNQAIVDWLNESVRHALVVEFNRFIAAGDLKRTQERMDQIEQNLVQSGGFVGMYLRQIITGTEKLQVVRILNRISELPKTGRSITPNYLLLESAIKRACSV